jgi:AraC-like DNA-binding protein
MLTSVLADNIPVQMLLTRQPCPALRPFVKRLWLIDQTNEPRRIVTGREHVLPTGDMHLVFRLSDHPLRLFDDVRDVSGHTLGHAIVGGARAGFYVRDISRPACSAGAQLNPGAATALFGMPADELTGRHTRLDDLWGPSAGFMLEQLLDAGSPGRRLDILESILAARLSRVTAIHPAVARGLEQLMSTCSVRDVVRQSGYSHRRFIALFGRDVGLAPKLYRRVLRFQHVLKYAGRNPPTSWAGLALDAGYSDQAHFNREFREFSGITPGEYREISPSFSHHIRVGPLVRWT